MMYFMPSLKNALTNTKTINYETYIFHLPAHSIRTAGL